MIFHFEGCDLYYTIKGDLESAKNTIIFLHGFTGSSIDWEPIEQYFSQDTALIFLDLPGHGNSGTPEKSNFFEEKNLRDLIFRFFTLLELKKPYLCGYSMGGRLALSFALSYPHLLKGLILISSSPGINSKAERNKRIKADNKIVEILINDGIASFTDNWLNLSLFSGLKNLKEPDFLAYRNRKLKNDTIGLIRCITGFGQGKTKNKWGRIKNIKIPLLVLTGSLDKKYCDISRQMKLRNKNIVTDVIEGASHSVHIEKPEITATSIINFLKTNNS
ncbi:MAG: 2-succinyl-6-hydroxy-2,4-cyclohexadiene-1-carboxylate synthase [Ignavibacteriaceae bacterium]|nr:2-succinyl-6-hydroxy-2,4-cyclohexadiene-1-carboxylate synthase [Ignavibacteriaceae bacterium]